VAGARCAACVDVCPRDALGFRPAASGHGVVVRVEAALCDGCDLCVPACPSEAIGRAGPPLPPPVDGDVLLACAAIGPVDGIARRARVGCLDAFGLADLARSQAAGGRRIVVAAVSCDACPRRAATPLATTVATFGRLARSRRLEPLRLEALPIDRWIAAASDAARRSDLPRPDRRAFFRRLFAGSAKTVAPDPDVARCASGLPLAPPGEGPAGDTLVAAAPSFAAERCDGCDACVRLCPRRAWRRDRSGLTLAPAACDGCGLCVDVCDRAALRLDRLVPAAERRLPLEDVRCRGCGGRFSRAPGSTAALCRVCAAPRRSDRRNRVVVVDDVETGGRR